MSMMLAYKVLAAVMAVVVAVAGMGGSVLLAADSLPGQLLYPVKLISEDVSLALTLDPASRAELALDYASERVQEMERLLQRGEDVPDSVVARLTRQMEQAMVEIARSRPEEVPALLERVTERTRIDQQALDDAAAGVGEETQARLHEASQVMERARQSAENDPLYLEHQQPQVLGSRSRSRASSSTRALQGRTGKRRLNRPGTLSATRRSTNASMRTRLVRIGKDHPPPPRQ
jgi:hypothetical protein